MKNKEVYEKWCEKRGRLIRIRLGMIARCYNPNNHAYLRYGGRGIKVCDEWLKDKEAFIEWAKSNGYSHNLSIDRINNDGDYEPSNCRWVDKYIQANNTSANSKYNYRGENLTIREISNKYNCDYELLRRRVQGEKWDIERAILEERKTKHNITIDGITKTLSEWAREKGVARNTAYNRYNKGLPILDVLNPMKMKKDGIDKICNPEKYKSRRLEYHGEYYTLVELARKFNLTPQCLGYRLKDMGMSVDEAVKYQSKKAFYVEYERERIKFSDLCKRENMNASTVRNRLSKGMTLEEAFDRSITSPNGRIVKNVLSNKTNGENNDLKFVKNEVGVER